MDRPIVQLHTLQQWFGVDPVVRSVILQHLKIKERLQKFLIEKNKGPKDFEAKYVRCAKCSDSQYPGYLLLEPRYPGLHPSQLPHPCLLKNYNEMKGVEQKGKIEPRMQLIFDLGHAIHHMFQTYGMNGAWGPVYRHEVPINEAYQELAAQLMIEGHADAENVLTVDDIPNSPYIYEVGIVHEYKSMNAENFKKLTRPKADHKIQAMLYSAALNRPIVVYLYMNKNDSNLMDFPVEFDPELWTKLSSKAALLKWHYDESQPPPAETGFHCQDCSYSWQCEPYQAEVLKRKKA